MLSTSLATLSATAAESLATRTVTGTVASCLARVIVAPASRSVMVLLLRSTAKPPVPLAATPTCSWALTPAVISLTTPRGEREKGRLSTVIVAAPEVVDVSWRA